MSLSTQMNVTVYSNERVVEHACYVTVSIIIVLTSTHVPMFGSVFQIPQLSGLSGLITCKYRKSCVDCKMGKPNVIAHGAYIEQCEQS